MFSAFVVLLTQLFLCCSKCTQEQCYVTVVCLFLFNTISQKQSPQDVLYCNVKALHSCVYLYFCLWAHFTSSCISPLTDSASISVSPDLPRPLKLPARYCFCSVQVLHWALQPTSVCCSCVLSLEGSVKNQRTTMWTAFVHVCAKVVPPVLSLQPWYQKS